MSLSETLFGWGHRVARGFWHGVDAEEVAFEPIQSQLRLFAALLFQAEPRVEASDQIGGFAFSKLQVPATLPSRDAYLFRVVHGAAFASICPADASSLLAGLDDSAALLVALICVNAIQAEADRMFDAASPLRKRVYASARERKRDDKGLCSDVEAELLGLTPLAERVDPRIVQCVRSTQLDLAGTVALVRSLRRERLGSAEAMPWGSMLRLSSLDAAAVPPPSMSEASLARGRELKAKAHSDYQRLKSPPKEDAQNPIFHALESVQTAEEYSGGNKPLDGSDEADEHAAAVEELTLRSVVRSNERTETVLKSNLIIEGVAPELMGDAGAGGRVIDYPEWDHQRRQYRQAHCQLRAIDAPMATPDLFERFVTRQRAHRHKVEQLRRKLLVLKSERQMQNARNEGTEIDLDALISRHSDLRAGATPSERLYRDRIKTRRDVAVFVLIDSSLSTDGWVQNQRVLDVETSSVWILGQVLSDLAIDVAVGAFHSHTRRDCRFLDLKHFGEDWSATPARLAALQPTAYTRMGPALRHAISLLSRCPQRRKYLLTLTDAKPTDYDRYEGRYGIADVRQAVREASMAGISTHALAIDPSSGPFLAKMFPRHRMVSHPSLLADAIVGIFREIESP